MLKSTNGLSESSYKSLRFLLFTLCLSAVFWVPFSCSSLKNKRLYKEVDLELNKTELANHHIGFILYDPRTGDTLYKRSSNRYFVPASNVKILTLYTALKLLPERMPALKYQIANDTLYFEGTGDPSALHPHFRDSTAIRFLSGFDAVYFHPYNFKDGPYGKGWAWEDFDQYYAPQRSSFPLYGNVAVISPAPNLQIEPGYFTKGLIIKDSTFSRNMVRNLFYAPPDLKDSLVVPIRMETGLTERLLSYSLGKEVGSVQKLPADESEILYGIARDSLLKHMMLESDNFLAEQLLIATSSIISDTLSSDIVMEYMMDNELTKLRQPPRWVDGSGLSRYNLFTPESMVWILNRLYTENGDPILNFFPWGGHSGTLKEQFQNSDRPYVFAKTGSLGNIYCLSGYLLTKSEKILIFSFMHNNYRINSSSLKEELERTLKLIRDLY